MLREVMWTREKECLAAEGRCTDKEFGYSSVCGSSVYELNPTTGRAEPPAVSPRK